VYAEKGPAARPGDPARTTCRTEVAAQIELGKVLEQVLAGRQPESDATVAQLLDQQAQVAEWDLSTRTGFEGYIRRTIKLAAEHQGDDATRHVLINAGERSWLDVEAGFLTDLAAQAVMDGLAQLENSSGRLPAAVVTAITRSPQFTPAIMLISFL
jgi:hypothetical protein